MVVAELDVDPGIYGLALPKDVHIGIEKMK